MLVPFDEQLGVHPQAEGFTEHQRWDFEATAPEQYPLLLHFPYFDLYRKQVVKQADLVLALHLRGDAFTAEQKARNFAYYERLTVRDSSLSACTQAVIAAEVGHLELAYDYFAEAALIDLETWSTTPATASTSHRSPEHGSRWSRLRRDSVTRRDPQLRAAPAPGADPSRVHAVHPGPVPAG